MKHKLLLILFLFSASIIYAQEKKFQINGAARGYYFSNELDIAKSLDTVTTRNANYGHTLLDLGISAFPNKETEIISIFRIRNELGGFWGGGVSFDVRQLTLRGVAGGIVKYEVGDIDLKMTPYTLYNFNEEGYVNEADAFSLRRDIVHYDMFYTNDNTWRMQGAKAQFGLKFPKGIKEINLKGFITRQRPTDGNITPERVYGGGTINIKQSDNLSVAFNSVNVFDLTKTIQDSIQYKNSVHTSQINYMRDLNDNISYGLSSEGGISNAQYKNYSDERAPDLLNEWFYDVALKTKLKKKNITLALGYKDVGADFLSPGAQTRRLDFSKFPGVYQQFTNNFTGRPLSSFDVISANSSNSFKISEELLPYYAAYNNTNPYGLATPNRTGVYFGLTKKDSVKIKDAFFRVAALTQSRAEGTEGLSKKNFILLEAGTDIHINDFFNWEKQIKVDLGYRFEHTSRNPEKEEEGKRFDIVNLNSSLIDFGLSYEFASKLDLLLGAKIWIVEGVDFMNERNQYNIVDDFTPVEFRFTENTYAAGLRYRFNNENTLSMQYQMFNIQHKDENIADYGINQFNILYSLFF